MKDGFPHSGDVLLALVLALPQVDVGGHFVPPRLPFQLFILLPQPLLLMHVFLRPLALLLLFPCLELGQLLAAQADSLALVIPFFLLSSFKFTLFYLSWLCTLSSSPRILLVVSSYSKSLKSFSPEGYVKAAWG